MPGEDAGRVPGRSPCPDRGHGQAPAAPVRVRGGPAEGPLSAVLNPLRSEAEAFRFLIYVVIVAVVITGLVLLFRAIF